MKNSVLIIVIVAAVASGVGFFAGTKYAQNANTTSTFQRGPGGANMMQNQGGFVRTPSGQNGQNTRMGYRPVAGEIIKVDDSSITIQLEDGSTKIVILSEKTQVNKAEKVTKNELKVGEQVSAFGTENNDGSVTATSVQLGELGVGMIRTQQEKK